MGSLGGFEIYNPDIPFSPFIHITMGGKTYEGDKGGPNFMQSLSLERYADGRGKFEFNVADASDYELEQILIDCIKGGNSSPLNIRYGHRVGKRSESYNGIAIEYTSSFLPNMNAIFTVTGICDVVIGESGIQRNVTIKSGGRVSDKIKEICLEVGWTIGEIFVNTDKVSEDINISWDGESAIQFIRRKMLSHCKIGENSVAFTHTSINGKTMVTLEEVDLKNPKSPKKEFNFVINGGNYGSVLSFTPTYSGSSAAHTGVVASYIDKNTSEIISSERGKGGSRVRYFYDAESREAFESIMNRLWLSNNQGYVQATLEIVGDPSLNILDTVNILPIRSNGMLHHSAGTYMVTDIQDRVDPMFTTSLTMMKIPNLKS